MSTNSKILIVDDDSSTRILLSTTIRKNFKINIIEAEEGSRALRMMLLEQPDLVILDIQMPIMSGIEVLKTMQGNNQLNQIKVLACTSISDQESVQAILSYGVRDYVLKPIKKKILINKISNILQVNPQS